jgi:agmatine deiminase
MPAEWEPHRATWIAWPHEPTDWPGKFSAVAWVFAEIARWVARGEMAEVVVQGRRAQKTARTVLEQSDVPMERVRFHPWRTDRSWTRDSGPTFLRRDGDRAGDGLASLGAVHWKFNAWAKYDNWSNDRRLPERVAAFLRVPRWCPTLKREWVVLEGGAIDVNGRGTLLATEECLLRSPQARNPRLTRADIHRVFHDQLHVDEVIWLPRGLKGDDTHGHIDDIARFVGPRMVVAVTPHDERDPNRRALSQNLAILRRYRDRKGRRLKVLELPSPEPVRFRGETLPASYANFYIANRAVLVPTFNDPADSEALSVLSRAFPERTVVGVAARDLVWGLGTIHCSTQQEPAVPS